MIALKQRVRRLINRLGYDLRYLPRMEGAGGGAIPDAEFYQPVFSPWLGYGEFAAYYAMVGPYSLVSPDRCWTLYTLARQALRMEGVIYECGVYKGGTAMMLVRLLADHCGANAPEVHLFDTFRGMPATDPSRDIHREGDFSDTSLSMVSARVEAIAQGVPVSFHPGLLPDTFRGREGDRIALSHIDVDLYKSVLECCEFIYPRTLPGGFLIFDDYGFASCPGARQAVDEFFRDKPEEPLVLASGQAVVFRGFDS